LNLLLFPKILDKKFNNYQIFSVSKLYNITCCTSAVVDRNNSIYRVPMVCLCLASARASSPLCVRRTNASPVALPSILFTNKMSVSAFSSPTMGWSPLLKNSICTRIGNYLSVWFVSCLPEYFVIVKLKIVKLIASYQ